MNRNRYDMDELLDDDLMAELTERTFQRVEGDRLGKGGRLRKTVGILVACTAFVLVLTNFDSVLAAVRTFITYVVGDAVETDSAILTQYEVLESPVPFTDGEGYWVDLAYRKNDSLYFNISLTNQDMDVKDTLYVELAVKTYRCTQTGGYTESRRSSDTGEKTVRSENSYMLEDAPEGNTMTLRLEDHCVTITLEPSPEYAADTVRKAELGWLEVDFIPLSKNRRVLGYVAKTEDSVLKDAFIFFPYGEMKDQDGKTVKASYIGGDDNFSHELVAAEGTVINGFSSSKVGYRLGGAYDSSLGEYRFTMPEKGKTIAVNRDLEISGITMKLKTIQRSAEDEITFTFAEETNRGTLTGMTLGCEENENISNTTSTGNVFTAGISWSWTEFTIGGTAKLMTLFPYETGDEVIIIFREIEGEMEGEIQVQWDSR